MKNMVAVVLISFILCGCSNKNTEMDRVMNLRSSIINADSCQFSANVTADFSDKTYSFSMRCEVDKEGNTQFEVIDPSNIAGISGKILSEGGQLLFDDAILAFHLQVDGLLSPVSAPWVLVQALRGGYVRYCGTEDQLLRLTVDDSYETDALTLDIWLNADNQPIHADIYENNRRIFTISITDFQMM